MALDIAIGFASLLLAYAICSYQPVLKLLHVASIDRPAQRLTLCLLLALAWHTCFAAIGLYRSHRLSAMYNELIDVSKASALAAVCVLFWSLLRQQHLARPLTWNLMLTASFGLFILIGLALSRIFSRSARHLMRVHGNNLRNIVVVGTNRRAIAFANDVQQYTQWGYRLTGFVDDEWYSKESFNQYGRQLLGNIRQMPELLRTMPLDEVIVALPMASYYRQTAWIVSLCKQQGILVRFAGNLFDLEGSSRTYVDSGPSMYVTLLDNSWNSWSTHIKRCIDLVVSLAVLIAALPLLLAIVAMIKATSKGPVFFQQERLGQGKRVFKMMKFRTMVPDAESRIGQIEHLNESQGPTFKLTNDPRITRFGKFLRKTSLDELPQLVNVIRGDMSLVGPRPLPLRDCRGFSEDWHRRRFSVKPGITCLWQVAGRSSIGFDEWMKLDMAYIDRWSLWLDVKILVQTIPAIVRGTGAV